MRKLVFLFILFLSLQHNSGFGQETKRALFLGNSYTAANNLPSTLAAIASTEGHTLIFSSNTPGGYTLEGHSSNANSLSLMETDNWDFVVLQEQSQMPAFPEAQVAAQTFPYAAELCDSIRSKVPCALPMFYMTWGRENGDQDNCAFFPPICTYEGMQDLLSERYLVMAQENDAACSPVGEVWRTIKLNYPEIDLYSSDGSHPTATGTYLAACTFFVSMFQESLDEASEPAGVSSVDAEIIRAAVNETILGNEADYFLNNGAISVTSETALNGEMLDVVFQASSNVSEIQVYWPTEEIYLIVPGELLQLDLSNLPDGIYEIQYIALSECGDTESSFILDYQALSLQESENEFSVVVTNQSISLDVLRENTSFTVYNSLGQIVHHETLGVGTQSFIQHDWMKGWCLIVLQRDHQIYSGRALFNE